MMIHSSPLLHSSFLALRAMAHGDQDARLLDEIAPITGDRTLWFHGDINSIGPLHNGASLVDEHHYAIPWNSDLWAQFATRKLPK